MAIKELLNVLPFNYSVDAATIFYSGMVLARGTTGTVVAADRNVATAAAIVGLAADDKAKTGVTMIQADPVGSNYVDSFGVLQAANNGWFVGPKRGLGDNAAFDETVTGVTNLTAGASGAQTPLRGVGVYQAPGQFVTDQFVLYKTNDTTSSITADAAFGGGDTFLINDLLTYGVGANAGKLVKVTSAALNNGKAVAKVDLYDANQGLLYITLQA